MRVLLFTGKGGVGKTSLALATALHAAARGARVCRAVDGLRTQPR